MIQLGIEGIKMLWNSNC